jgi:hypothetical protein
VSFSSRELLLDCLPRSVTHFLLITLFSLSHARLISLDGAAPSAPLATHRSLSPPRRPIDPPLVFHRSLTSYTAVVDEYPLTLLTITSTSDVVVIVDVNPLPDAWASFHHHQSPPSLPSLRQGTSSTILNPTARLLQLEREGITRTMGTR